MELGLIKKQLFELVYKEDVLLDWCEYTLDFEECSFQCKLRIEKEEDKIYIHDVEYMIIVFADFTIYLPENIEKEIIDYLTI